MGIQLHTAGIHKQIQRWASSCTLQGYINKFRDGHLAAHCRDTVLNERFFLKNLFKTQFLERTILLNKQFYWTIVHWENKRNRWKMNNIFENDLYQFLNDRKKHERNEKGERAHFYLNNLPYYQIFIWYIFQLKVQRFWKPCNVTCPKFSV